MRLAGLCRPCRIHICSQSVSTDRQTECCVDRGQTFLGERNTMRASDERARLTIDLQTFRRPPVAAADIVLHGSRRDAKHSIMGLTGSYGIS